MVITVDIDDVRIDTVARALQEIRGEISRLGWQVLEVEKRVVPGVVERRRRECEVQEQRRGRRL